MGNYSSAYEEYYKNINNKSITKESGNRGPFLNRGVNNTQSNKFQSCNAEETYYFQKTIDKKNRKRTCWITCVISVFYGIKVYQYKKCAGFL